MVKKQTPAHYVKIANKEKVQKLYHAFKNR